MSVINIKSSKKPENYVYIGRPSDWGNPFEMTSEEDRNYVVTKYKLWLNTQQNLLKRLFINRELDGKVLGCYCKPKACHGDILYSYTKSKWVVNWFSNMTRMSTPIVEDGIEYFTVENYYQASKVNPDKRKILAEVGPHQAKKMIRNREEFIWSDWTRDKAIVTMRRALEHKFSLKEFEEQLMMTEDWEITEWNNWGDLYWGKDVRSGKGENHLGKILMGIRDEK